MRLLVALCFALFTAAAFAGTAGQVMFAYGETHALRAGRIIQLHAGSEVESGDQLHTGVGSYLQIRFTDWGVMSLRPHTDFVIDDYVYEAHAGGVEHAFFSLLNGGVRSITGLIGHRNRDHYRMRTNVTSIGIRGTHYAVLICHQDCKLDDGSLGEDGVYGGVVEGRIAVTPYGGTQLEREFGAGEYFRVLSANTAPERFSEPPPFFWDKREPQARAGHSTFAGITWKPSPGAPSEVSGSVAGEGEGIAGSLLGTNGSLTLSPITAPVLNQVGAPVVNGVVQPVTGIVVSTLPVAGALVSPLAGEVVLPAAGLAGSIVNSTLSMPALGQVAPLAGSALNAVPVVVAPVMANVGGVVNTVLPVVAPVAVPVVPPVTVPPVTTPTLPPITTPTLPPVTTPTVPITTPTLPPVTTPTVPIATPTLPPVTTPTVPITTPTLPPVTTPTVPITTPTLPPVTTPTVPITTPTPPLVTTPTSAALMVIAPAPPPVALPTLPSLPLSKGFVAPLKR